jgi:hypothetical protein
MLILFAGMSRGSCKFLRGPARIKLDTGFRPFETLGHLGMRESDADSRIVVAQPCASRRSAGPFDFAQGRLAKAPVSTLVFHSLCVDINCCGR